MNLFKNCRGCKLSNVAHNGKKNIYIALHMYAYRSKNKCVVYNNNHVSVSEFKLRCSLPEFDQKHIAVSWVRSGNALG